MPEQMPELCPWVTEIQIKILGIKLIVYKASYGKFKMRHYYLGITIDTITNFKENIPL